MLLPPLRNRLCLAVMALLLAGCTGGSDEPRDPPTKPSTTEAATPESVAQDLLPNLASAPSARSNLPRHIDVPGHRPPSLMTAVPARAKLGMVRVDQRVNAQGQAVDRDFGFADQDVYFLGLDNRWRSLNLAELRLPASDWTGPDGSGMGDLSPDGTQWLFETNRHVVVLDLLTTKMRLLGLPGGRKPVSARWTARHTLLVGLETDSALASTSYEIDPKNGHSTVIKAPHDGTAILADGTRAMAGVKGNQPYIDYFTVANKPIKRVDFDFEWEERLGPLFRKDVAVFVDSLGLLEPVDEGSMLAVFDQSLRLKATLPWPKRRNGDSFPGWISDNALLLTYGRTMAVWCPDSSKVSRVSTVPTDLAISMAMDVVKAKC